MMQNRQSAFPTITIPENALILITASEILSSRVIIQRLRPPN
jgi:hypothetical protein